MVRLVKGKFLLPVLLLLAAAAGCTAYGVGFDDPKGEVSLVGDAFEGCTAGRAFFFGAARNTGQLEVRNVEAVVDVYSGGALIGRFRGPVSRTVETVEGIDEEGLPIEIVIVDDTLEVDQKGTFHVNTSVGCGASSRSEYSFDFTVATFEDL